MDLSTRPEGDGIAASLRPACTDDHRILRSLTLAKLDAYFRTRRFADRGKIVSVQQQEGADRSLSRHFTSAPGRGAHKDTVRMHDVRVFGPQ